MKQVFPEIFTSDNTLRILIQGNRIIIAPGQKFRIQDVIIDTTNRPDTSLSVSPNTTYHLRYSLNGRPINNYTPNKNSFYLVSVNDPNYNPNNLPETDEVFDTQYDDMLIAKIVVNSSGNITITPLKNKSRLRADFIVNGVNGIYNFPLNFSRTPRGYIVSFSDYDDFVKTDYTIVPDNPLTYVYGNKIGVYPTRYEGTLTIGAWNTSQSRNGLICASVRWEA